MSLRRLCLLLAAWGAVCAPSPIRAELRLSGEAIRFSAADREVIERNAVLRDHLVAQPWLVRRILDLRTTVAARRSVNQRDLAMPDTTRDEPFDAPANPDLSQIDRSSSEAAHDLFQLLKQAQPQVPPPPPPTR